MPSASLVPCVRSLPDGWTRGAANVRNGWSKFTLDHDRLGRNRHWWSGLPPRATPPGRSQHPLTNPGHGPTSAPNQAARRRPPRTPFSRAAASPPGSARRATATRRSSTRRHPPSASLHAPPSNKHSTNAPTGDSTSTRTKRDDQHQSAPYLHHPCGKALDDEHVHGPTMPLKHHWPSSRRPLTGGHWSGRRNRMSAPNAASRARRAVKAPSSRPRVAQRRTPNRHTECRRRRNHDPPISAFHCACNCLAAWCADRPESEFAVVHTVRTHRRQDRWRERSDRLRGGGGSR